MTTLKNQTSQVQAKIALVAVQFIATKCLRRFHDVLLLKLHSKFMLLNWKPYVLAIWLLNLSGYGHDPLIHTSHYEVSYSSALVESYARGRRAAKG